MRQSTAMPPSAGASLHTQTKLLWILWILWIQSFTEWDAGDYCWSFCERSVSDKSHITIPVSHGRDPLLSFFHVYWRFQVILWEWLQHSYRIISVAMYILLTRISLVFSAVCTTCLMLHIQSGCILMEEAALSIKVSVITRRWIFVSLCFHCGFNFWIHLDQFLLPYWKSDCSLLYSLLWFIHSPRPL